MQKRVAPILLAIGLLSGSARAGIATDLPHSPSNTAPAELCLHIVSSRDSLDTASLRSAIEAEFGLPTSLVETAGCVGTVSIESGQGLFVTVRYKAADGSSHLERRIATPRDPVQRVTVVAWLAGNLVRNEANEILIAILERRAAERRAASNGAAAESEAAGNESGSEPAPKPTEEVSARATKEGESARTTQWDKPRAEAAKKPIIRTALGPTRAFHGALFSPALDTDAGASKSAYAISLGAVYSRVGSMKGFGLGLFVDHLVLASSGAEIAGVWIEANHYDGMLLSGFGTHARGDLRGAELSGIVAWRTGRVDGIQVAGVLTAAGDDTRGLQLSGVLNYQGGRADGAQVTGGVNVATDVQGLQLGLVNVARDVDGVQLGIVNVSRQNRGAALGLFNWSEDARVQPTYFFQTPGYHNAGYRTISGYTTGTISFGYDPSTQRARTHFATGPRVAFNRLAIGAEFGYGWVLENMTQGPTDRAHELDLIGSVSATIVRRVVSLYGGGGLTLPVAGTLPIEPRGLAQIGISLL